MIRRPLASITVRTLSRILIACLVTFSLISILTVLHERDTKLKAARDESHRNVAQNLGAISAALWNYDINGVEALLTGLTQSGAIVRVEVLDEQGAVAAAGANEFREPPDDQWLVDVPSPDGSGKIGTLHLYGSYHKIRADMLRTSLTLMFSELAKVLALAAILFFLIYRTITRHLVTLSNEVANLRPDDLSGSVKLNRKSGEPDELDALVTAINSFHHERADERQRRQRAEDDARQRLAELARLGRIAVVQSLSATIAHEINQPLGAILSNSAAAQIHLDNGATDCAVIRDILGDIRNQARRAAEIVAGMRAMFEKRNARMELLELNELIAVTRDLAKRGAPTTVRVDLDLAADISPVRADRVQIQQVILNLVTNAIEALSGTGDQGIVTIRTRMETSGAVFVSISDNGPGISAANLTSIFDPFHTTKPGGTGMGLWISHMLVEQHGGKLRAENLPSGGACLSFSLPGTEGP